MTMRKVKPISADNIDFKYDNLKDVDPEVYDFLFRLLCERGYIIDRSRSALGKIIPTFDHFAWRVEDRNLKSTRNAKIGTIEIIHQGFHVAIAHRFGHRLQGRPLLTLLNECLGTGLDLFIAASQLAKNGLNLDSYGGRIVRQFLDDGNQLDIPIMKKFNDALKDPFAAARRVGIDTFNVHKSVYMALQQQRNRELRYNIWEDIINSIKANPYYVFTHKYTLAMPALNIIAYCGHNTNKEDQKLVEECIQTLFESKSLLDFLSKITAKQVQTKTNRKTAASVNFIKNKNPLLSKTRVKITTETEISQTFKIKYLSDSDRLRQKDPYTYDFLVKNLQSRNVKIDKNKTWLLLQKTKKISAMEQFNGLEWFFTYPAIHFDQPNRKISSKRMIAMSVGSLASDSLRIPRKNFPFTTLFVYELTRQIGKYFENVRARKPGFKVQYVQSVAKSSAYAKFQRDLFKDMARRKLILSVCLLKFKGTPINGNEVLRKVHQLGLGSSWKDQEFGINALATGAFCGFESCNEDNLLLEKCYRIIRESKSIIECLLRISNSRNIEKYELSNSKTFKKTA
jgi:hypothetical protein